MKRFFLPLAFLFTAAFVSPKPALAEPAASGDPVQDVRIVLHTDKGDIEATIFASKVPMTAANFLNLAQQKFYDGLRFHRVIADFMIQGGDPQGTGGGGPGYTFEDEKAGLTNFERPGILAMANRGAGTNSNGSQFFITHVATPWLNGHHTIFGQVTKGQEVVNAITQTDHIKSIDILDPTAPLFAKEAEQIDKWNKQLVHPAKH